MRTFDNNGDTVPCHADESSQCPQYHPSPGQSSTANTDSNTTVFSNIPFQKLADSRRKFFNIKPYRLERQTWLSTFRTCAFHCSINWPPRGQTLVSPLHWSPNPIKPLTVWPKTVELKYARICLINSTVLTQGCSKKLWFTEEPRTQCVWSVQSYLWAGLTPHQCPGQALQLCLPRLTVSSMTRATEWRERLSLRRTEVSFCLIVELQIFLYN